MITARCIPGGTRYVHRRHFCTVSLDVIATRTIVRRKDNKTGRFLPTYAGNRNWPFRSAALAYVNAYLGFPVGGTRI